MTDGPDTSPHVAEVAQMLDAAPAGEPGMQVWRGRTAVVMIRTTAAGAGRVDVLVTIQLVVAPAAVLRGSWVVAGPPGDRRYAEIDGSGQAELTDVAAGSWPVTLVPGRPPSGGGENLPADVPALGPALHAVAGDDAVALCEALMEMRGKPVADPNAVLRLLGDHPEPLVREAAADVIAEIDDAGLRAALLPTLQDPAPAVAQAAAVGLGHPGQLDAVPALIAVLIDGTCEPGVREAAAASLGWIGDPAAVEALRDASDTAYLRETARRSLALLGEVVSPKLSRPADVTPSIAATSAVGAAGRRALRVVQLVETRALGGRLGSVARTDRTVVREAAAVATWTQSANTAITAFAELGRFTVAHPAAITAGALTMLITEDEDQRDFVLRISGPAELVGMRVSIRSTGEVPRLHSGRFNEEGQLVLRGVTEAMYLAEAHVGREQARLVALYVDRATQRAAVRGSAPTDVTPGDTKPLLKVHDPEGRTMTVLRAGSDIVAQVVGLGIGDRRTVLELPIVVDPAEVHDPAGAEATAQVVRLVVPLRWNPESRRCEALIAVHRGDAVDQDRPPQVLEPSELTSVRAVAVSVGRTRAVVARQWGWLGTDERVPPAVREVVSSMTSAHGRRT